MEDITIVISGAGASAIACATHYLRFGVKLENIIMVDSKGVLYKGRKEGMNKYKETFAVDTKLRTLEEVMKGADVFVGLSRKGLVSQDMVKSMAKDPIIFAMANPDPEITYPDAVAARSDVIMATGRSDFPNQVNNVLGFPFIFRGALDVHAKTINDEMKVAASLALAKLAKEDVPDEVASAYGVSHLEFGPEYIIPKPFDPRVLMWEASAVAQAAMDSGVAEKTIDIEDYKDQLEARLGGGREMMRTIIHKAQKDPKRIVFPEGTSERIIRASSQIINEKIAIPILLGDPNKIQAEAERLHINLDGVEMIRPSDSDKCKEYATQLYDMRQRKGMTRTRAHKRVREENWYGPLMVLNGEADGMVSGVTQDYADVLRPAIKVLKTCDEVNHVASMQMLAFKNKMKIFADIAVNIDPDAETLAEITLLTAREARRLGIDPKVAMLSFSNFGSVRHPQYDKIVAAKEIIRSMDADLLVEGPMHADVAVSDELLQRRYPFSVLQSEANVLIFPDLMSGNTAYKLLEQLGGATAIGPILLGMSKPVHVLQAFSSTVQDIVNITAIATLDAQHGKPCQ